MSVVVSALEPRPRPVHVRLMSTAEIPPGDAWLGPHEREVVTALGFPKRRADWRLGRYAAKRAAAGWLGRPSDPLALAGLEVIADDTGAPRLHCDGARPLALSLSHRAGWALAAVAPPEVALGCDLELVEARSEAFRADHLTPQEQALVAAAESRDRAHWASLVWCLKECALRRCEKACDSIRARSSSWRGAGSPSEAGVPSARGWWRMTGRSRAGGVRMATCSPASWGTPDSSPRTCSPESA
jgi:phosphopantetheinyl transferase (holo-ACP synthase)